MRVVPTSTRILGLAQTHGVVGFPGVETTNLMNSPADGLVVLLVSYGSTRAKNSLKAIRCSGVSAES